jgi:hypothetical protein
MAWVGTKTAESVMDDVTNPVPDWPDPAAVRSANAASEPTESAA